jgi:cysteine-rich repeat protein
VAARCGETCDDGNGLDGDGCSASCELEGVTDQRTFSGTAQGGGIGLTLSGVALSVPTSAGQSSAAVAAAVAAAINASAELQGLGVSAVSSLEQLFVIGGTIDSAASSDPGIAILGPPLIPALPFGSRISLTLLLVATALIAARGRNRESPLRVTKPPRRGG